MIAHDSLTEGFCVIDPHGSLAQKTLSLIPLERENDIIYISPSETKRPVSINFLSNIPEERKSFVAEMIVSAFKTVWPDSWGPRMEYVFINSIRALLDVRNSTLNDIPRLLSDTEYRKRVIRNISDPTIRYFWTVEFASYNERFATEALAPVQNKIGRLLGVPALRAIVSEPHSTIDFRTALDTQKILIINLSKGSLGEGPAHIFGALIVSAIANAALSREDIPEPERVPFHLYADEFQNFATNAFSLILSEARKYALTLTLAHQHLGQLPETVRQAVFGNAATTLAFRVGAEDAPLIGRQLDLEPRALQDLPNYHLYLRTLVDSSPTEATRITTLTPPAPRHRKAAHLKHQALRKYGR